MDKIIEKFVLRYVRKMILINLCGENNSMVHTETHLIEEAAEEVKRINEHDDIVINNVKKMAIRRILMTVDDQGSQSEMIDTVNNDNFNSIRKMNLWKLI